MIARSRKGLFDRLGVTAKDVGVLLVAFGMVGGSQVATRQQIAVETQTAEQRSSARDRQLRVAVDSLRIEVAVVRREARALKRELVRLRAPGGQERSRTGRVAAWAEPDGPPEELAPRRGLGQAVASAAAAPFRALGWLFRSGGPGE